MSEAPTEADVVIVGGGIAGASLAFFLAPFARVVLLEREEQPGYHSTGRSAAMFIEAYGPPMVRALTRASRSFLEGPPHGFAERPVLSPRGVLVVGRPGEEALMEPHAAEAARGGGGPVDMDRALALVPVLRREQLACAVHDPAGEDIDVDVLHQGYLRGLRQAGGRVVGRAELLGATRGGDVWRLATTAGTFAAPVVVDAAGAWADEVAALFGAARLGLEPRRRTAFLFSGPDGLDTRAWPMTMGADDSFYFKPDAGRLLGSPVNADPVPPQDVQPEEYDIALGIHNIEAVTTLSVGRPQRSWAGLRTFAPDGELVAGYDPAVPGFFWLAGQGGYGIQTSAAMGEAAAALLRGQPLPDRVAAFGVTGAGLSPSRFTNGGR